MAVADKLIAMDESFKMEVDKYIKIYQVQNGLSIDEATQLAKQTAMANRLAAYFRNKPGALQKIDNLRKIADTMDSAFAVYGNQVAEMDAV